MAPTQDADLAPNIITTVAISDTSIISLPGTTKSRHTSTSLIVASFIAWLNHVLSSSSLKMRVTFTGWQVGFTGSPAVTHASVW